MTNLRTGSREATLDKILAVSGILAALLLLFLAEAPADIRAQLIVAAVLTFSLVAIRPFCSDGWPRQAFLLLGAFITVRYIMWRAFHTLGWYSLPSEIAAVLLFLAEAYGTVVYLLGIFVNLNPLDRRIVPLSADEGSWPSVDVFITTYNESFRIVQATVLAAAQINYPAAKLNVHLLDDGGTDQKLNDPDPDKARFARERQVELKKLCADAGIHYLTRKYNKHAKSGNINSALAQSKGEFILLLDADHIPTKDILINTVGFFGRDSRLWLVQTPHFFGNPDPIERNLDVFSYMPGESEMFYGVVQRGLDFWNASFFCGSAGVLRRSALVEIGGMAVETVTEDAETSIIMHSLNYKSAYLFRPMISGLAPETFSGFITQRIRWAQGMAQIFVLKNPFRMPGLKIQQRLAYFSSTFFWFFPYARIVFLLAPFAYLVLGLHIYNANMLQILGYTLPHLVAGTIVSEFLFGKVRWTFISELYEIIQSFFCFTSIVNVLRNPRSPVFAVTPKGETLTHDFISPLARPFYIFLALTVIAWIAGIPRLFLTHQNERYAVVVTLIWTTINMITLLASLGVIFEHKQRRSAGRLPADFAAEIVSNGRRFSGSIQDLSEGGASVLLSDAKDLVVGAETLLVVAPDDQTSPYEFSVRVRNQRPLGDKSLLGLEFSHASLKEVSDKIAFVFGDSQRWSEFQRSREHRITIYESIAFLLWLGLKGFLEQLAFQKSNNVTRAIMRPRWRHAVRQTGDSQAKPI